MEFLLHEATITILFSTVLFFVLLPLFFSPPEEHNTEGNVSPGSFPSCHSWQYFQTPLVIFQSNTWTFHWVKVKTDLENRWGVERWTFATHWALTPAYFLHLPAAAYMLLKILPKWIRTCNWMECKWHLWKWFCFYLLSHALHSLKVEINFMCLEPNRGTVILLKCYCSKT